jgi:hypothetical protein
VFAENMKPDMTWLIGRRIKDIENKDYSWFFFLDDGSTVGTESVWRLITAKGIAVTSEDDGQPFGLPVPVNAAARVKDAVGQNPITRFELEKATSDLVLHFSNDTTIEFLNLSCGYEGWRTVHGAQEVICMGGGGLTEFDQRKK